VDTVVLEREGHKENKKGKEKVTKGKGKGKGRGKTAEPISSESFLPLPICGSCGSTIEGIRYLRYSYPWNPMCSPCYCNDISLIEKEILPPTVREKEKEKEKEKERERKEEEEIERMEDVLDTWDGQCAQEIPEEDSTAIAQGFCHWCHDRLAPGPEGRAGDACVACYHWFNAVMRDFGMSKGEAYSFLYRYMLPQKLKRMNKTS